MRNVGLQLGFGVVVFVVATAAVAECMNKKARISMCPAGNIVVCNGFQPCHAKFALAGSLQDGPFSCESQDAEGKECVTMTVAEAEASQAGRCYIECVCVSFGGVCDCGQQRQWVVHTPVYKTQNCGGGS